MQKKLFPILTSVVLMTALFSGASALDPRVTNQIQKMIRSILIPLITTLFFNHPMMPYGRCIKCNKLWINS